MRRCHAAMEDATSITRRRPLVGVARCADRSIGASPSEPEQARQPTSIPLRVDRLESEKASAAIR